MLEKKNYGYISSRNCQYKQISTFTKAYLLNLKLSWRKLNG